MFDVSVQCTLEASEVQGFENIIKNSPPDGFLKNVFFFSGGNEDDIGFFIIVSDFPK